MLIKPKLMDMTHQKLFFGDDMVIESAFHSAYLDSLMLRLAAPNQHTRGITRCCQLVIKQGFTAEARLLAADGFQDTTDTYVVRLGETTEIEAGSMTAALYALHTLIALSTEGRLTVGTIYDAPDIVRRGYRGYLPSRKERAAFLHTVDLLVKWKYNTIILEVGGAMEYERHPEINRAWSEFAADMRRYSGRTLEIQWAYAWEKDSIHVENADGEILTKDEVREIVNYCRACGLEVIPEVPTLSHADYILLSHPELRERKNDPYPDTYCPSNPDVYPIVYDILDEVLEVFEPTCVNIGHDEYYSVGLCEECRGISASELFARDVHTLRDYLAARHVRTMMWAEKLLDARHYNGETIGGAGVDRINEAGFPSFVPPMLDCAKLLPKDTIMINWYWEFGAHHDSIYRQHGYEYWYGNLNAILADHWRERVNGGVSGAFVSNWGSYQDIYMQRNLQYFSLLSTAYICWSSHYDAKDATRLAKETAKELYAMRRDAVAKNRRIEIVHTTTTQIPHEFFYCGIFVTDEAYLMGHYRVVYHDATYALFPVRYGEHVSSDRVEVGASPAFMEVCGSSMAEKRAGRTVYRTCYENPFPEKPIVSVSFEPNGTHHVELIAVTVAPTQQSNRR